MVRWLIRARTAWLAWKCYRSIPRAAAAIRRMMDERARYQRPTLEKFAHAGGRYFWSFYAPGWPSAAFDRFIERDLNRAMVFREEPAALQTVVVAMTKRCSWRCQHCCEWDVLNQPETLTLQDLQRMVSLLQRRGAAQLLFSGGEPLQRFDDLLELVRSASSESDLWILSSGGGLTAQRAVQLRRAGLTGVALSLDHWRPEEHDAFRGVDGAYAWVDRAASHARRAGLLVCLTLCATRAFVSAENLEAYARTAGSLGAAFIHILEPQAVGRFSGHAVELLPTQIQLLEDFWFRMNFDRAFSDMPGVSYLGIARRRGHCYGAGDRHVYIDTDGNLHPCPFCRVPTGRVLDGSFATALERVHAAGCPASRSGAPRDGLVSASPRRTCPGRRGSS
jgi:MoaA/NifB/PqqE/SkfB family radical SAM enzyme